VKIQNYLSSSNGQSHKEFIDDDTNTLFQKELISKRRVKMTSENKNIEEL
jgi:hypothetical protein